MSIEDPRLSSIDNTSAADEFDSAVEQHLGFASETVEGIEVAQVETPDAGRTDRLPAQQPVDVAAAVIPSEVTPDNENVVTLPAGIELDNLEFQVDGENLVLVLADGTEITVIGGAANIPTFVVGDVELPQVALFAALEESNINVAAGPDGTFSAQGAPISSRSFNDDPIGPGPEDLALADLLGDTSFGDELRTGVVFGGNGRPSIPTPLTTSFIYDEAVIAGGDGVKIISGRLPFNPGPDSGTITAIGFVGASDVNEGDGLKVLGGFTSGGLPITVTSFPAPTDGTDLDFLALEGRDSAGNLVFTITITNRAEGDFTFELFGKLEHPDAGSNGSQDDADDLLRLGFTYTVTDRDGDSVTGTFNIDVQDDAPTIGAPVGGSVNEDDLTSQVVEPKLVKRVSDSESDSDLLSSSTSKAEGSLAIRWGADNDLKSETFGENRQPNGDDPVGRTVSFTGLDTSSTSAQIQAAIPGLAGLSSDGFPLSYRIDYTTGADGKWNGGYQLVAYKTFFDGPFKPLFVEGEGDAFLDFPYRGEGETIFIITLNPTTANGSYTFELIGNLDHYAAGGNGSVPSETDASARVFGPETPRVPVDFLDFEIPFTATDSDGDSADGKFTVRVEDDEPVIIGRPIAHTVDEDDISTIGRDIPGESLGTSPNDGNRDGSFTGDRGSNNPGPATVSGSFAGMVDFGADNRFTTYSIIDEDAARDVLTRLGLTSKGGVLSFDLIGDTLYAFVNAGAPGVVYNAGPDRLVFTLTVEADGEYAFKLFDQLDHDLGKGQNTDLQDKIEGDVRDIDFGQIIKASDFDGDSVPLTGYFSVTIRDDVPELVRGASEHRTVDEDDISTLGDRFPGESLGTSPNDGNADGSFTGSQGNNQPGPAFLSGSLASLVKSGADESLTFSFINGDVARGMLESLGLSSKGAELSYEIRNGVLYAFDNAGSELGKSYDPQFGDRLVFELKLNGNGSYEFRLYDQLDHDAPGDDFWERPTNSDENFDLQDGLWFKDVTAINFGALIKATDYDGDSVSLNNAFSIKIRDDVPELSGREENRLVDEDDIRTSRSVGTSPNDGNGDGSYTGSPNNNQPGPAFISGSLANLIKGGADDTVKFSFIREQTAVSELQFLGLSSKGVKLSYDIQGKTLYAYDNDAGYAGYGQGDRLVFKLTVNEDGSYTFELHDQLDHDLGKGQNTDLQDGFRYKDVEAIDFGSIIKATDFDGDSVILKDAFSITIKDDVPELSGAKEERLVDEDDIKTSRSVGTSPNDGNGDGSFTGSPNNNQSGPAFISGSLANLIKGGADDTVNFSFISEQTAVSALRYLGLSSKGAELSYDIQGNTLYAYDNNDRNSDYGHGDRLVFKLTVNQDGSYTFELHDQLDHNRGKGENTDLQDDFRYKDVEAIDFGSIIKATDFDGDSVILKDAFTITIKDDVPTAVARNTNETLVVDESDRRQNDDVDGPLNVFRFVGTKGEDPNMSAQFAQQSNFVAADINGGADDDVKIEWDLKINGGDRTPSGLFTTDGRSIVLFLENGLIVGRYDGPDGNSTVNSSDPAAFALHLSDNGTLSLVQYVSIRHDDPSDHDENDDANDRNPSTALQTLAGKVNAVLTVTDYDGDKAVSEVAVGNRIQFEDDGPVANFSGRVTLTEDANVNTGAFIQSSANGQFLFDAGADGAKVTSIAYGFGGNVINDPDEGSFTTIPLTSGGLPITVANVAGDPLKIEGKLADGTVIFRVEVTNPVTGAYTVTQLGPIDHPEVNVTGAADPLRMKVNFTVTDGDGDTSSSSIQIDILDDAPVARYSGRVTLTEDANVNTGAFIQSSANGQFLFDAGADGAKVTSIAYGFGGNVINDPDEGSFTTIPLTSGGLPITVANVAGDPLKIEGKLADGTVIFRVEVTNPVTGAYTVTQLGPIDHPEANVTGAADPLRMKVNFTVTDGDGDTSSSSIQIDILDDAPVARYSGRVTLTEDANVNTGAFIQSSANGQFLFDAGADGAKVTSIAYGFGGNVINDPDEGSFTTIPLTSGGLPITVANVAGDPLKIEGKLADGTVIFRVEVTNPVTGAYTVTQLGPIDHPEANVTGAADPLRMKVNFTVTDGDGDTSSSSIQIDILDDMPTLISTPTTGLSLNEDDLIPGNDETAPKELLSATGNLNISLGADGGSIALSAPAAEWSATNKTLTATDGSWKVTLNSDGTYKFDLLDNTLAHGFGDNGENTFSVEVTYTATDSDQDVLTGSFTIEIVDDVPVAVGESATVRESAPGVGGNLILAFDVSASMNADAITDGIYESRLDVAKKAALNLLDRSDATHVLIVTFNNGASSTDWLSKEAAEKFIEDNIPQETGGTNYDRAIAAITENARPGSTVYFFSDGNVSGSSALNNDEKADWEAFVTTNGMTSYAVGVGSNLNDNDDDLGDVAHPGEAILITTADDAALLATMTPAPAAPTSASGNVLTNDSFGADGGRIQSILVDGVTRTWNGTEANEVLNVTTALGGSLMFNFRTGDWEYNAPAQLVSNTPETFTYTLVDGDGDTTTASLVINVQAVNDAPENVVPSSLTAAEDIELSITNVSVSDVDAGNGDLTVKLEVKKGTLTLASEDDLVVSDNGSGTVTLTGSLTAINAALLGMKYKGDLNFNGSDELKITTTDNGNTGIGGAKTDVDTVAINVTPVNDAAVITGATTGSVTEAVTGGSAGTPTATGNLNSTDVDNPNDRWTVVSTKTTSTDGYGKYTIASDGRWTYELDNTNSAVNALNNGQTLTDRFTVTTIDGTPQVVTVTINGANDAAVITGATTGSVTEAVTGGSAGTPTATGNLNSTDVDNTDDSWTVVSTKTTSTNGYGKFTIASDGQWTYELDNTNSAVNALNNGQTLTDRFTVSTIDGTPRVVTVTINGANDAAVITGATTGSVTEAVTGGSAGTPTATGNLNSTDVDNPNDRWTVVSTKTTSTDGYGKYTIASDGRWTYELDNTNSAVNALNNGQTLTDRFTVTTIDGTPQVVTVTINGANDAAVITGATTGSVTEAVTGGSAGTPTATGNLNSTDVDNTDDSWTVVSTKTTSTNGYGKFTIASDGQWTYELDNTNSAVNALNNGQTLTDRFTVSTIDGTPRVVTVTINGANDGPVVRTFTDLGGSVDMNSTDKVVFNNTSINSGHNTVVTVSNFNVAQDKISISVGGTAMTGAFTTATDDDSRFGNDTDIGSSIRIVQLARTVASSDFDKDGHNELIEREIVDHVRDMDFSGSQKSYVFIAYSGTGTNVSAAIYTVLATGSNGINNVSVGEIQVEHLMTLTGIAYGSLNASHFVAAADPIILDLDRNGFAFSSIENGVSFDINADGKTDQIAWTSDDGILAYDVDGNGLIDNGSEIFTPDFNGGKFASGVAALASLDSNGDGKIDSSDDAFSKLKIWVDANNNGISDEGELSSLFDNGVTSISLTTDNTGGQEDGQTVFSTGTFTFADGSTGDFMEVGFDTIFGSDADPLTVMGTDGDDILHGGMGKVVMTGGAGNDTFVFDGTALDELDVADVITDFNGDGDVLDVTALLDSLLGEQASAETAASHLRATVDDGNTTVSVQTGADTWKDVVVLQNHDTAIKVLFDDKHAVVTPHD
jgi:T1SS-143 domain-containing protein